MVKARIRVQYSKKESNMKVTIEEKTEQKIVSFEEFAKLPDDTLGIITEYLSNPAYEGTPVRPWYNRIISLSNQCGFWDGPSFSGGKIRILPKGSRIILEQE
jgi:hypothetical protein